MSQLPRIFVGHAEHRPPGIKLVPGELMPPREMQAAAKLLTEDVFTNNSIAIDGIPGERVMVISASGKILPLTACPRYQKWFEEMTAGEMWSFFGEAWVDELPDKESEEA